MWDKLIDYADVNGTLVQIKDRSFFETPTDFRNNIAP